MGAGVGGTDCREVAQAARINDADDLGGEAMGGVVKSRYDGHRFHDGDDDSVKLNVLLL